MKVELYNQYVRSQMNRRSVLKGAASVGALAAMGGAAPALAGSHSGVRAEIMKIPGVGMGSPGDPEWQKVGELCICLLYTSPSPRDSCASRMPSSA